MLATRTNKPARLISHLMAGVCVSFGVLIVALLLIITGYLVFKGSSALSLEFFTADTRYDQPATPGGMRHAILGTLALLAMASLAAVPIGIAAGIYLAEYPGEGWLTTPVRFLADVLTGVPSIVVGILGYELVVRPMGNVSGYAGAFALAFIMIPIIARTTEEMLLLVPRSYREGSMALGATKAQTILKVVLPAATGSVVTGVVLALARVAGETAPLLFTIGASRFMPGNPGEEFPSLMRAIYDNVQHPSTAMQNLAWGGILVLLILIFILNVAIRTIAYRSISGRVAK